MLHSIYATYSLTKSWFENPSLQRDYDIVMPWVRLQELNDYAYYILIFAQLEEFISVEFLCLRDQDFEYQKQQYGHIDFMGKVEAVFDRNTRIYKLIDAYYNIRNALAHGNVDQGLFQKYTGKTIGPISIDRLYRDVSDLIQYHS